MKREWKPGDVAMRRHLGKEVIVVATSCGLHVPGLHWHLVGGGWDEIDASGPTFTPLVVIDPEDREQVERIVSEYVRAFADRRPDLAAGMRGEPQADAMQAALRELANPTPPKPDEPTRLYARVEDAEGRIWVRTAEQSSVWRRECRNSEGRRYLIPADGCEDYADIAVVHVLSEGVQP